MHERRQWAVRRAARLAVEWLERRTLLSVNLELNYDDWWVVKADHDRGQHIRVELVPGHTTKVPALIDGKVVGTIRLDDAEDPWIDVVGGAGDDRIEIGDGIPILISAYGGDGDDTIVGSARADDLGGGSGNDLLYGEIGDDDVSGGPGKDYLYGEAGPTRSWVAATATNSSETPARTS